MAYCCVWVPWRSVNLAFPPLCIYFSRRRDEPNYILPGWKAMGENRYVFNCLFTVGIESRCLLPHLSSSLERQQISAELLELQFRAFSSSICLGRGMVCY